MALATKVRTRKGQHVVGLPASIARHLVIAPGALVYWGMPRAHQALLSVKPTAQRGPERREVECSSCAAYRKEIAALRQRLQQQPAKLVASALTQVRLQWLSQAQIGPEWVTRIEGQLERIEHRIAELPGARVRRAPRASSSRRRPVEAFTLPDAIPSPSPSPSSEFSGGDAASGGDTPQAAHE